MKKWAAILFVLACIFGLAGCQQNKAADLVELSEISALVSEKGFEAEDFKERLVGQSREDVISLWGEPNGGLFGFCGDIWYLDDNHNRDIALYYDGDGYIENVAIRTVSGEAATETTEGSEQWDLIPMVMVNGELYLDTGRESTVEGRCGMMDGEITSAVDGTQKPTEDDQSNFGTCYGYQYGAEPGTIELYINDKWWIFATETAEDTNIQNTFIGNLKTYYELSDGTWQCDGISYKYRLELTGTMPNASASSTFVYLSNVETISFQQAYLGAGVSSNTADYFSPEDAVLVDWLTE